PANLFKGWEKPDLVLVLSGSQHGYLLPCGCSRPQLGGLERRYNFVQLLRDKGWPVVLLDAGDVPQVRAPAAPVALPNQQGLIKYKYAMRGLRTIGYSAVGLGEHEASFGLLTTLGEFALNDSVPAVLAANLKDRLKEFPRNDKESMVGDWEEVTPAGSAV